MQIISSTHLISFIYIYYIFELVVDTDWIAKDAEEIKKK
jgi:hypothetical protein